MWTTHPLFGGHEVRVRLANGKLSVVLGGKEYVDLVAALRLRLGETTEAEYRSEACRPWGAQPIEVFGDILTLDPEDSQAYVLRVQRGPGLPVEYRVSRDEAEEMLAGSQQPTDF